VNKLATRFGRYCAIAALTAISLTPAVSAQAVGSTTPPVPSYLQTSETSTVTPELSGVVQDTTGAALTGEFFLLSSSGTAIGGSPTATGVVASGDRNTYQVPDGVLTNGTSYEWYMEACIQGTTTCSAPTATMPFTINTSAAPAAPQGADSVTISGSSITDFDAITDPGGCSGSDCAVSSNSSLQVGGDGTNHWASALDFNLSAVPADAVITSATLDLTQTQCIGSCSGSGGPAARPALVPCPQVGGSSCSTLWAGTLDIYAADSSVTAASTGPQLAATADPNVVASGAGNAGSYDLTSVVQSWLLGGTPNDGLVLEAAGNSTAPSGAAYASTASSTKQPQLVVSYAPAVVPGPPTSLSVTAGDGGVIANWAAPSNAGDATGITGYTVQAITASGSVAATVNPPGTWAVITGLTDGTAYKVGVTATNGVGTGTAASSGSVTPAAVGGSAGDVQAVGQFLGGQDTLQEGTATTASAALSSDSEASMAQSLLAGEQSTDAAIATGMASQGMAITNGNDAISSTLAVPGSSGNVSVYASDDRTFTTDVGIGTSAEASVPGGETVSDYLFTFSGSVMTGYVNADDATQYVNEGTTQTAFSATLNDDPDTPSPAAAPAPVAMNSTGGLATGIDPVSSDSTAKLNRSAAASWALNHVKSGNNGFGDDCTDFVSRALHIGGGMHENPGPNKNLDWYNNHYWWFGGSSEHRASHSWGDAADFAGYLNDNSSFWIRDVNDFVVGDVAFADWKSDSFKNISHAALITSMVDGVPFVTQHTRDRTESLEQWLLAHPKASIWVAYVRQNNGPAT
jgi:hypothetical protein